MSHTARYSPIEKIILTDNFPKAYEHQNIGEVEKILIDNVNNYKTFNYVFIVDDWGKLVGVVSVKDIFRHSKDVSISEIMNKKIVSADLFTTAAKVAFLAMENSFKEIPILNEEKRLVGVVPNDVIVSIAFRESRDDLMRFAGYKNVLVMPDNVLDISIFTALRHRLPWLLLGLVGGVLAAKIIDSFELTLQRNIILASFIPLIVYMSDAVGTQMEAFIIRDLALTPHLNFSKYFFKQLKVLLFVGIITSVLLFAGSLFLYKELSISYTLAAALFVAILSSVFTALLIPFIFSKFKIDPANASGPIATIIQDILSVVIYFSIATLLV